MSGPCKTPTSELVKALREIASRNLSRADHQGRRTVDDIVERLEGFEFQCSFDEWWHEVVRIGKALDWPTGELTDQDREAWHEAYECGESPMEAWNQEFNAGQD